MPTAETQRHNAVCSEGEKGFVVSSCNVCHNGRLSFISLMLAAQSYIIYWRSLPSGNDKFPLI